MPRNLRGIPQTEDGSLTEGYYWAAQEMHGRIFEWKMVRLEKAAGFPGGYAVGTESNLNPITFYSRYIHVPYPEDFRTAKQVRADERKQ